MIKKTIHTATGVLQPGGGNADPSLPVLSISPEGVTIYDPDYSIVELPGEKLPESRTQKVIGGVLVNKSQAEIDAHDAALPKEVDAGDLLDRFTDAEYGNLGLLADTLRGQGDPKLGRLMARMGAGSTFNVHSPRVAPALAYVVAVAVPSVWPDTATANVRLTAIFS